MSGMKIKLRRIERGYKQYEFAQKVGVSRNYIQLIENGKARNPSLVVMKRISELLETPVSELFFDD